MRHRVYLDRISRGGYLDAMRKGLEYIGFANIVSGDSRVFIKPNLTFPTYRPGVMTSPEAVEAAIIAVSDYTSHVTIGDSDSGGYNPFSMHEVYRDTGLLEVARKHGVRVLNLSDGPRAPITFSCGRRTFSLDLPTVLTDQTDLLVTMPVPKVHCNTTVSLTFKNQWGCIPEPSDRLRLHPYLAPVLLEVNRAVHARVAIMDGRYGLNENGPMRGTPVDLDWVMVADDIGAGALIACELMQVRLDTVRHLKHAAETGHVPAREEVEVNCDSRAFLRDRFLLRRAWTDYPGYLAFNNSFLAYLAYFSPLAGFLHRVLYLFREPFYDYEQGRGRRR